MGRKLAGRALLLVAGAGTVLGAGAGIASAAPLEHDLATDQLGQSTSMDQLPSADSLPQAPTLDLVGDSTHTDSASKDLGSVNGDQLAALTSMSDGALSGLGSGS